jgi:antitoxin CptB
MAEGFALYPWAMTDLLETRRKRLRYRAWHRGTKELDLLLGSFADERLASMDEHALTSFEVLCEVPESQLYCWVTSAGPLPEAAKSSIAEELLAFAESQLPELLQDAKG